MLDPSDPQVPPGWELIQRDWGLRQNDPPRAGRLGAWFTTRLGRVVARLGRVGCPARKHLGGRC